MPEPLDVRHHLLRAGTCRAARNPSSRTRRALFWVAALGALGSSLVFPAAAIAQSAIERIQEIAASDDLARNRAICAEILASEPPAFVRSFCQGYDWIALGLHEEVWLQLEECLARQPEFSLGALLYGRAYEAEGDIRRAERYYQRAIEIQPKRTDARNALGRLYLARARAGEESYYPQALEAFRQMAEADPRSPDGFTNMAIVLTEMDRLDDALTLMERALAKDPDSPALYSNLAALHLRRGEDETAERYWRQTLALQPAYGPAALELATFLGRDGRLADAFRVLQTSAEAARVPPWGPRLRRTLGFALLGAGAPERARDVFLAAVAAGGDDALSHLGLGHVRMLEGLTSEAVGAFRRGAALDSTAAVPFLRAWRATLSFAVQGEVGPLARALERIGSSTEADPLSGATGPEATPVLVRIVLGDWNFDRASAALEEFASPTAGGDGAYDVAPQPVETHAAKYPAWAQERGIGGEVKVRVTIDAEGEVIEAKVESSTAEPALQDAAVDAARKWKFKPAMRLGMPVEASIVIPFRFEAP